MDARRFGEVSVPETYASFLSSPRMVPVARAASATIPKILARPDRRAAHLRLLGPHRRRRRRLVDELPPSLVALLRDAHQSDATHVLFDADLLPLLDLPVFDHLDPLTRPD